jgi:1,4-alpha-glucan branching enzyme
MKTSAKKVKRNIPRPHKTARLVRFEYLNPLAQSVYLAGTFNDWHPSVTEMLAIGEGRWTKEVVLTPGRYEYRLVVDGLWLENPNCPVSTPNPYGERNSVLTVPPEP